ncbi:IPT/TIG domain-containing protein [Actinoplanes sp. Pm04-4]|uniref:IPT/TIG domain-containing protein n=1 Tax=Paractinoplanes pyxinae TaxID=2997416 RepID=A0ABT4BHQ2_9ACTN|nr:IPT/TIG domain-containing protein [Actinoplanes pyxinae]MCY1145360.1 IPT/TIG domain-containing protein [Actinoplanes pyxinae]
MRREPLVRNGIAAFAAAALGIVAAAPAPAWAAPATMTLSSTSGPSGGGNSVTATVAAGVLAFPAGTTPVVQFQYNAPTASSCGATAKDEAAIEGTSSTLTAGALTVDPAQVRRLSTTKIAFTVPAGLALVSGQSTSKWNVCVYNNASTTASTLIATSVYSIAQRPAITAILPARGPAAGGQTITVNGSGFSAGTTATIDGAALTGLTLSPGNDSFTAVTPAHIAGSGYALMVRTAGGVASSADPDNDPATADNPILFSFDNSIVVSPNSAPAGSSPYIDIRGQGFDELTFDGSGTPTDANAHVFLVRDVYDPASNRGIQECGEVLVLDDTELICRLDLAADSLDPADGTPLIGVPVAEGTYTVTIVADGTVGATGAETKATIVTSGATFTVGPY